MNSLTFQQDCTRYMNPCPYTVSVHAPITKVFTLFRSLGLRHLIVVNNAGEVIMGRLGKEKLKTVEFFNILIVH